MLLSLGLSPSTTCFIILAATVALFVWNRLPVGLVALAVTLSLIPREDYRKFFS